MFVKTNRNNRDSKPKERESKILVPILEYFSEINLNNREKIVESIWKKFLKEERRKRKTVLLLKYLTFLKSGNTFDYMKHLRNTKINDPKKKKKKTKTPRVEI